jgi:hypothetical protein
MKDKAYSDFIRPLDDNDEASETITKNVNKISNYLTETSSSSISSTLSTTSSAQSHMISNTVGARMEKIDSSEIQIEIDYTKSQENEHNLSEREFKVSALYLLFEV